MAVPRTLGNSHHVSNSHLTFSSVDIPISSQVMKQSFHTFNNIPSRHWSFIPKESLSSNNKFPKWRTHRNPASGVGFWTEYAGAACERRTAAIPVEATAKTTFLDDLHFASKAFNAKFLLVPPTASTNKKLLEF